VEAGGRALMCTMLLAARSFAPMVGGATGAAGAGVGTVSKAPARRVSEKTKAKGGTRSGERVRRQEALWVGYEAIDVMSSKCGTFRCSQAGKILRGST